MYRALPGYEVGHHDVSHGNDLPSVNMILKIQQHIFSYVGYFKTRLRDEALLDSTLGFVTNEIGSQCAGSYGTPENPSVDGNHGAYNMQTMLFGLPGILNGGHVVSFVVGPRRGGRWSTIQGRAYNDLLVTIMHALGVPSNAYEKPGVKGYGDYRGDIFGLVQPNIVSPPDQRGKPLAGILKIA